MARRDPHDVLGVPRDASAAAIKAAWRRLARENHPDLTAGDPAASRRSTRRMAEINAAYEELRVAGAMDGRGATTGSGRADGEGSAATRRPRPPAGPNTRTKAHAPGGAPRPRPGRPVTGRVDMTGAFDPGTRSHGTRGPRAHPPRQTPPPDWRTPKEPLRASDPTGPLRRRRDRSYTAPPGPSLEEAAEVRIAFGKFHGHTLGEIAAFEPSYIDWLAGTITRDRDLLAAARVVRADLDARAVRRISRAERVAPPPPETYD